jgi:DNA transformation protein and related proteins
MPVSSDYLAYVREQLGSFANVTSRRMFGGVGLYADGLFFAIIDDDVLYFKVNDSTRSDYLARGSKAFRPLRDDPNAYSMSYFEVPVDVLEDPEQLALWARRAQEVAQTKSLPRASKRSAHPRSE